MSANKLIRGPFGTIMVAALLAAVVTFFVFVQSGEAAPAADEGPSAAKASYQVVGGKPVPDGKYPFMATLIDPTVPGTFYEIDAGQLFCGGSLIDKNHVLTAGHCIFEAGINGYIQTPQNTQVLVGRTVINSDQGQVHNVKDIDVHPAYKGAASRLGDFRYDVAVITLSDPVSGIEPIKLASSSQNYLERPGRGATLAGWGNTTERPVCIKPKKRSTPSRMREAQVPIISDSRTEKVYDQQPQQCDPQAPSKPGNFFFSRLMIAAGNTQVNACQGDSGGPLFVRTSGNGGDENGGDENGGDENGGDEYTQIGIASFVAGCAASFPGVFTEVNNPFVRSFITNVASK